MDTKKKIQSAKDYEVFSTQKTSKAIVPTAGPSTPQKLPNRFSPLQKLPEIPYNTVLASNIPKPTNVQIPNASETHSYFTKESRDDCGMTYFTEFPSKLTQNDFIREKFNPSQLWESDDAFKDQRYYELVLIDSNSIEIVHNPGKTKEIEFSKCIIKRFQTLTTFGGPREFKKISVNHPAQGYHYYDYKNAWFRAFLLRPFNHSWFFSFHPNVEKTFPMWILDWWHKFGSSAQILPSQVKQGFNVYAEFSSIKNFQKFIMFHAEFKIPWIFAWDFYFEKIYSDPTPFSLVRVYRVKWWSKFQEHLGSEATVRHFLTTGQKIIFQKEGSKEKKGKEDKKASSSKEESILRDLPDYLKKDFFEYLAQKSTSSKTKSEESVSSDPIEGQDPFDF